MPVTDYSKKGKEMYWVAISILAMFVLGLLLGMWCYIDFDHTLQENYGAKIGIVVIMVMSLAPYIVEGRHSFWWVFIFWITAFVPLLHGEAARSLRLKQDTSHKIRQR